jgi:hypothetical protein
MDGLICQCQTDPGEGGIEERPKLFKTLRYTGLTPLTLATQEAEIKRIEVQSQPGQIVLDTLSQKIFNIKKG